MRVADTGAGDLGPEAKLLVDAWLAAQDKGDFAAARPQGLEGEARKIEVPYLDCPC